MKFKLFGDKEVRSPLISKTELQQQELLRRRLLALQVEVDLLKRQYKK